MPGRAEPVSSSSRWPEAIAVFLSVVALGVSGYSMVEAQRQHQDERTTELMDHIYDEWQQMTTPERWEVSHLGEVPGTYDRVRNVLRAYAAQLPVQEQRRIYLLERSTAASIFTTFELTANQWRRAVEIGDVDRQAMLEQELDYFVEVYLRNPRLLWLWSTDGGGLELQADPPNIELYHRRVLDDPEHPLTVEPDPDGILPGFDG